MKLSRPIDAKHFRCWCLSPGSPFHMCVVYICAPAHVLAAEKGNFPMGSITKSHRDSQQRAFDYTFQRRRPSCPQYLLTVFSWLGKDISYLADIYVPPLGFNPKESWTPKRLSNKRTFMFYQKQIVSGGSTHSQISQIVQRSLLLSLMVTRPSVI